MKKNIFYFLFVLVILIVISGCNSNNDVAPETQGEQDTLAQCLTEKGAKMYGTEWCGYCKKQKESFGSSFQYVDYVNCEEKPNECQEAGVKGYPTWKINGENYAGLQPLDRLATLSGC